MPTTEIVTAPLPSPTALSVEEPPALPTTAAAAPDPTPTPAASATAVPATPLETVVPVPVPTAQVPAGVATAVLATPVPIAGSQAVLAANGAEVFTLNCARCHGENGLGSQQYSAGLIGVGSQYSTAGMIAELTTGHPVTFGFADRLSAEEIASVVVYVKSVFP